MKWSLACLLLAAGCGGIPADTEGTLERVEDTHRVRIGIVAPADEVAVPAGLMMAGIERSTGARPELHHGNAERLLGALADGELDLVVGRFGPATPWAAHVHFLPPLHETAGTGHHLTLAAVRNGENAWVARLAPIARDVRAAQ